MVYSSVWIEEYAMAMDRVSKIQNQFVEGTSFVAILIGEPDADQRHIGILYRIDESEDSVLHLAWHCRLQNETTVPSYFPVCVRPRCKNVRLRQAAGYCRRVFKANESTGIPYAFSPPVDSLDPQTGVFLAGPTRLGLTCASFVLAIFASVGLDLIEYASWSTDRQDDREWQEAIIEKLVKSGADLAHIEHLRAEKGAARFRPEEVAAGTALAPPPAFFDAAAPLGEEIVEFIRQSIGHEN
jgi:hypothetical protein